MTRDAAHRTDSSYPPQASGRTYIGHVTLLLFLSIHIAHRAEFSILAMIVDNADPTIQYKGAWTAQTGLDNTDYYAGTIVYANVSGATATLVFTGNCVKVFGAIVAPPGTYNTLSTYTIDGGPPTVFQPPSEITTPMYNQLFFGSGTISYGLHTIVVKNMGEQFWLDTIVFDVPDPIPSSVPSRSTQETTPGTSQAPTPSSSDPIHATTTNSPSQSLPTPFSLSVQGPTHTSQTQPAALIQSISSSGTSEGSPSQTASSASENQATVPFVSGTDALPPASLSGTSLLPGGQPTDSGNIFTSQQHHKQPISVIAGATFAGVALLGSILVILLVWRRRQKRPITTASDRIQPFENYYEPQDHSAMISALSLMHDECDPPPSYPYTAVSQVGDRSTGTVPPALNSTSQTAYDNLRLNDASDKRPAALPPPPASAAGSPIQHTSNSVYPQEVTIIGHDMPMGSPRIGTTERRQAVDGGLRIAGGVPGEEQGFPDNISTVASTLPPSYEIFRR
ncbi:hypothetical protein C2E23DRAFT_229419 [Lenzites betulinus]|nr:hypothetical protein C2E23DRAFT_229419 [Lenzites betulinus]